MIQKAILAGGCFWCTETLFSQLHGVETVLSGYTGGNTSYPDYEAVCQGDTGHAEAVQITFDASIIHYTELLEVFFAIHDPTTLNRQGHDTGTQYRSAIFFLDEQQQSEALGFIQHLTAANTFPAPIVTEVVAAGPFYAAEPYHQRYFENNAQAPYCQNMILPKLRRFLHRFKAKVNSLST